MYKNTVVLASAPQRNNNKKREQKKGTNSGEESEKTKSIIQSRERIYRERRMRAIKKRESLLVQQSSGSQSVV